jgi:hypothetical protein
MYRLLYHEKLCHSPAQRIYVFRKTHNKQLTVSMYGINWLVFVKNMECLL